MSGPLAGLRVLDLGGSASARIAGAALADHGADVVAVRPHGADRSFDRGKRVVVRTVSPTTRDALARGSHVVLDGRPGDDPARWLQGLRGIRCRLPAFPAGHPLAGREPPPGVVEAAAAAYAPPIGEEKLHPFALGAAIGGLYAAVAAAACALRGPQTRWLEITELDAALHGQELGAMLALSPPPAWPTLQWASSPFVASYRAADGRHLFVHAGLSHHLDRLLALLAEHGLDQPLRATLSEATRSDPIRVRSVREGLRARRALTRLFAQRPAGWWEDHLAAAGIAAAVCRTSDEWRSHPHPQQAGEWVQVHGRPVPGPLTDLGSPPVAPTEVDPQEVGWEPLPEAPAAADPPLAGVRVLDLSQVIAGPAAGRALALLGAEVDKVLNPRRPAGWTEAFRALYDAGKRPHRLDLTTAEGQRALATLLDQRPDVVLHNLRPDAAERLGLGVQAVRERAPDAIVARVTAYGLQGAWGGRPGWEQTAQAAVGLQAAYGGEVPELIPVPATDLCTGLATALGAIGALYRRERGGAPDVVTTGLTRTTGWLVAEPRGEWSTGAGRSGSREPGGASSARAPAFVAPDPSFGLPFRVPRTSLRQALAARPDRVRRAARAGIGPLTEVGAPWSGPGLAVFPPEPEVPDRPALGARVRWVGAQVRWGGYLALTRLARGWSR